MQWQNAIAGSLHKYTQFHHSTTKKRLVLAWWGSLPVHIKVWTMLSHSNNKQYQDVITTSATTRQKCVTQLKQRGTTEQS